MSKSKLRRYSVYERGTDRPIYIYGTARECAKSLGVDLHTFYIYIQRARQGKPPKRIEIFIDDIEDEEDLAS